jgi:hypothetical protein
MPRFVLRDLILWKKSLFVAFLFVLSCMTAALAFAQHPVVHPGGGAHAGAMPHMVPPRLVSPPIHQPRVITAPPASEAAARGFGPRPIFFSRRHEFFFGEPYYGFGANLWLESYWWMNCGSFWTWEFGCYGLPTYPLAYENFVPPPPPETRVYVYGAERHDQVQLFLKDGRIYNVTDYWFVNNQLHFSMVEEFEDGAVRPAEHVIGFDELDLQKTIDVNTRRGFRLVMRDEPWQQYLREHPDANPPAIAPPKS